MYIYNVVYTIGYSGMGKYFGKSSFDIFSHYKSVLHKGIHYTIYIIYMYIIHLICIYKFIYYIVFSITLL